MSAAATKDQNAVQSLWTFLGSLKFATLLFILLGILTFAGTWEQQYMSLYDVQVKYFESVVLVWWIGDAIPVPLLGGYTLLTLLFINLLVGGVIRIRKRWTNAFILVTHFGILSLLLGTFVEYKLSTKGQMRIYEDDKENEYYDIHQWEVIISAPDGDGEREYIIPGSSFMALGAGERVQWNHPDLPFDITISDVAKNGQPQLARSNDEHAIEGFFVARLKPKGMNEGVDVPALVIALHPKKGQGEKAMRSILWGHQVQPWDPTIDGTRYFFDLRPRTWVIPFTLRLDKFEKEEYGGTTMAKTYSSYVTKIDGGTQEPIHITMNVPLRWRGYTFYQSDFGPKKGEPAGTPTYSVLSVVNNPSDQWPKWMLYFVIAPAMLFHFCFKLYRWMIAEINRQKRRRIAGAAVLLLSLGLTGCDHTVGSKSVWNEEIQRKASSVPVQSEGRVKPLYTWASFALLGMNHKRTLVDPDDQKLKPTEWFLDVAFRPEKARTYAHFNVKSKSILEAIGAEKATVSRKMSDRYSYDDFITDDTKARLSQLGSQYRQTDVKRRSPLQAGVVDLENSVGMFSGMQAMFDWARKDVPVEGEELRALFEGREAVPFSDVIERAPMLVERMRAGMGSDPSGKDASAEAKAIGDLMMEAFTRVEHSLNVGLFPPTRRAKVDDLSWLNLRDVAGFALLRGVVEPDHLAILRAMEGMARAGDDQAAFETSLGQWHESAKRLSSERGEYGEVAREIRFYAQAPFDGAAGFYGLALVLAIFMLCLPRQRWLVWIVSGVTLVALGYQTYGIVLRCLIRGHPPVSTLYETVIFIGATGVLALLVTEWMSKRLVALALAPFMGLGLILLANSYETLTGTDTMPQLVAVLRTNFWLTTHVLCITMGYMGGLVAALVAHVYIFAKLFAKNRPGADWYRGVAKMTYGLICFALLTSLVGTILGGVWANDSWGRFWGWDPKENGALLICLAQLAILHARMGGLIKALGISIAAIFQGMIIAASWWGVNLLGIGLHTYGFTAGVWNALLTFWLIETAVLMLGFYVLLRDRPSPPAPEAVPASPAEGSVSS